MKKEMLINVLQPEEIRIAICEDGVLEELYVERASRESYVGNIYKGRIVNIEPSIQAAFVDFGVGRNGFLHVSDVEPAYYRHLEQRYPEQGGRRGGRDRHRGPARAPESESESRREGVESADAGGRGEGRRGRGGPKDRRRGRGGSRRRRDEPREELPGQPIAPGPYGSPDVSEPPSFEAQAGGQPGEEHDRPDDLPPIPPSEYMDSAEHRTYEDDASNPPPPADEDLFFPRDEPAAAAPAEKHHRDEPESSPQALSVEELPPEEPEDEADQPDEF